MAKRTTANGPLIKTVVSPRLPLGGDDEATDEDKKLARLATAIVDEVWTQDGGRANQHENAVIGEFLGGCVFKLSWQPWRNDLHVPVVVEKVLPDYFMPIWNPKNYNDLFEVFEVYKVNAAQCKALYGKEPRNGTFALYVEHWKKDTYTITLDGEPITAKVGEQIHHLQGCQESLGTTALLLHAIAARRRLVLRSQLYRRRSRASQGVQLPNGR